MTSKDPKEIPLWRTAGWKVNIGKLRTAEYTMQASDGTNISAEISYSTETEGNIKSYTLDLESEEESDDEREPALRVIVKVTKEGGSEMADWSSEVGRLFKYKSHIYSLPQDFVQNVRPYLEAIEAGEYDNPPDPDDLLKEPEEE